MTKNDTRPPQWMLDRAYDISRIGSGFPGVERQEKIRAAIIEAMQDAGREVAFYFAAQARLADIAKADAYQEGFIAGRKSAAAPLASAQEAADERTLKQRDEYHDVADDLARYISDMTGQDIGEHSSANNPWFNACEAARDFLQQRDAAPHAPAPVPPQAGLAASAPALQAGQGEPKVTDEMVNRFLGWRLPDDFNPDCGISFKRVYNEASPYGTSIHEPTGTNLFDADQARKMLEHVLAAPTHERAAPAPEPVLPYDVTVGGGTFRKGVKLATFVLAAQRWHRAANPELYTLTAEQKAENLRQLQDPEGE